MAKYEVLTPIREGGETLAVGAVIDGDPDAPGVIQFLRHGVIRAMPGDTPDKSAKEKPGTKAGEKT